MFTFRRTMTALRPFSVQRLRIKCGVLGKLPVPGRPTIWMIVGQGPVALAVGAVGGCLDIFSLHYLSFPLSPSLWETVRYRLKYSLKGPLNLKQPTNQPNKMVKIQCTILGPYSVWITRKRNGILWSAAHYAHRPTFYDQT